MNDIDRMLREAADEVIGTTRPADLFLVRARARARRRGQRRMAATTIAAALAVALGVSGVRALSNDSPDVTVIAATGSAPERPTLSDAHRTFLGDACESWVPEVQSAEVVFATPAGYTAVATILDNATAESQRSVDQLIETGIPREQAAALLAELRAAETHLDMTATALAGERLDDAAVELDAARAALAAAAEILTDWGIAECGITG